jgi:hypothetical protein
MTEPKRNPENFLAEAEQAAVSPGMMPSAVAAAKIIVKSAARLCRGACGSRHHRRWER